MDAESNEVILGTVKSFGAEKGYGFVVSDSLAEDDAFFGRKDLSAELAHCTQGKFFELKGRAVSFTLNYEKGKPTASNIKLTAMEGETIVGQVKSYNGAKGYGFIQSSAMEGQDIFFSKRELPMQAQGVDLTSYWVKFEVRTIDNHVQARSIRLKDFNAPGLQPIVAPGVAQLTPMMAAAMGVRAAARQGIGMGMHTAPVPTTFAALGVPGPGVLGGRSPGLPADGQGLQGTVKSYNSAKGFGFIICSSIPNRDIYFKRPPSPEVFDVEEGSSVAFFLHWTPEGKPQARGVTFAVHDGQELVGTLKSFSEKNGYGFIAVPDQPSEVYFKKQALPLDLQGDEGDSLKGLTVRFTVTCKEDSKPQARTLEVLEEPPMGYTAPQIDRGTKRQSSGGGHRTPGPKPPKMLPPQTLVSQYDEEWDGGLGQGLYRESPDAGWQPPPKRQRTETIGDDSSGATIVGGRKRGKIKSYNPAKGYGFVEALTPGQGDTFFKKASLPFDMNMRSDLPGKTCSYVMVMTPDGKPQAEDVKIFG